MKIIQSFWSGNLKDINNNYGWHKARYNWLSWILSCNQLVKFYNKVELYTDDFGYDILINKLKLPYTKVHVILNELDIYPNDLWAIAKIKVYSLQEEPFIHVDGDVFIWDKFPENFINSSLFTQNLENTTDYYREMWNGISSELKFIPEEMQPFHNGHSNLCANMGIVGGSDIDFFKFYTKKSFEFVNKNIDCWNKINLFNFNIFFEQELFYELTILKSKPIIYLFDEIWGDNAYMGFGDFHQIPHNRTYLHLLGFFKRHSGICNSLEIYVMKYYPEFYTNFSKMFNSNVINQEIEFLTKGIVLDLITEFDLELRKNNFNSKDYLLKRNFYNEGLSSKAEQLIKGKINFWIVTLSEFEIKSFFKVNEQNKILEIKEFNQPPNILDVDNIDEIILEELIIPIQYFDFIKKMKTYLDDDDEDSKSEFLVLINNRLIQFVIKKVISIYQ